MCPATPLWQETVADVVLPPTVVSPIIADDTAVTVTNLQYGVQAVTLYVNGNPAGFQIVSTTDDVVFTIPPAVTGDVYTAVQLVNGTTSAPSPGVVVLPEAAPGDFTLPGSARQHVHVFDDEHHHEDEARYHHRVPEDVDHSLRAPPRWTGRARTLRGIGL